VACGRRLDPSRTYVARRRGSSVRLLSSSGKPLARCGERLHAEGAARSRSTGVGVYRGALETVPTASAAGLAQRDQQLNVNAYARGSLPGRCRPNGRRRR
jgi:hypothetical protein